jgi:hypothetical protein
MTPNMYICTKVLPLKHQPKNVYRARFVTKIHGHLLARNNFAFKFETFVEEKSKKIGKSD